MIKKLFLCAVLCLMLAACGQGAPARQTDTAAQKMPLTYAQQFSVDRMDNGCALIHIDTETFLLVPENVETPAHDDNVKVLKQPIAPIYLSATAAADLFDAIGALDCVTMTSTAADGWDLPAIKKAVDEGRIEYIGKYSAPDYEVLAESGCGLAIESTMIYHSPETKEQIENLGIPVLTERSSYEAHPMARLEWVKLYGLLVGREDEANKLFDEKQREFEETLALVQKDGKRPTAAFFYLSPKGHVNIRKPGDYVSKMIELAGGEYIFTADKLNVDENALSTMNIQLEEFYETAKDADVIIYNSTIEGEIADIDTLKAISPVFEDFRAVQNGNVWCAEKNMFQQTTGVADTVADLEKIFSGKADDEDRLEFMHRLK